MNEASRKWLYDNLTKKGYNVGKTYDDFARLMDTNEQSRRWAYDRAKELGYNVGKDFEQFNSLIGPEQVESAPAAVQNEAPEQPNPAQPIQVELPRIPTAQEKERQQAAVAGAQVGLQQATQVAQQPQQPVATAPEQPKEEPKQPEQKPEEPKPAEGEVPVGQGWKPTAQQIAGMSMPIDDKNAKIRRQQEDFATRMENMRRATQLGSNSRKTFNAATGQMEAEYYTTAGNIAANPLDQVTENEKTEATSSEEGRERYAQRRQAETEQRINSAISRVDPDNVAETVWQQAEEAANEEFRQYLENQNKPTGNRFLDIMAEIGRSNVATSVQTGIAQWASNLKQKDLERMADRAWDALGPEKQQAMTNEITQAIKPYYSDKTDEEIKQIASDMAREQSDNRMLQLAIEKNAPQDAVEYFLRKAVLGTSVAKLMESAARVQAGTTGDWAAREYAEQEFENKGNKAVGLAGTVTSFAIDPITWAAAGFGGAAVRGTVWLGGRMAGEAIMNRFMTTLGGRLLAGSVGGSANFAAFEAGGEAVEQLRWGGHRDETGEVGDYSAGAVGERFLHGLGMGAVTGAVAPLLGNVSDKLVRATDNTAAKVAYRTGELAVGTLAEGTIFSVPEWVEGSRDAMDVWTDNMAMITAFRIHHGIKSAPRVIAELAKSPGTTKAGFETRLRTMLDGRADLALTKDEQEELRNNGYSDLNELMEEYKTFEEGKNGDDNPIVNHNRRIGKDIPYNRFSQLMNDGRISEAARAKMYYYLTGRMLPMSTVMGSTVIERKDADGNVAGYTVQSLGANGVVTSRTFASKERAEVEQKRIDRQAELNSIDTGERFYDGRGDNMRMEQACKNIAKAIAGDNWRVGSNATLWKRLYDLMKVEPEQMSEVERIWAQRIRDEYERLGDKFEYERYTHESNGNIFGVETTEVETGSRALRESIKAELGVDVDDAIRKEPNRRSDKEKEAVKTYGERLFGIKLQQEDAQTREDAPFNPDAPHSVKQIEARFGVDMEAEEPEEPIAPRSASFKRGYDADLQERRDIAIELSDPNNAEAQEAWEGVVRKINEDADYNIAQNREYRKQFIRPDGSMQPAYLKEKDERGYNRVVYIVEGNVQMMPDGSMIDKDNSDNAVVIFDPTEGKTRQIDPTSDTGLSRVGKAETAEELEEYDKHSRDALVRLNIELAQGTVDVYPGQTIELPTGETAEVVAVDADKENITVMLGDGTQSTVLRSELQRYEDEKALADYNQRHGINSTPTTPEPQQPEVPAGQTAGAPAEYTPDMEITIRDNGQDKPAIIMGRVRYENGSFVPDENGRIVEYYMDGEVKHDYPDMLGDKVVSYTPTQPQQAAPAEMPAAPELATAEPETPAAPQPEPIVAPAHEPVTPEPAGEQPMPMKEDGEEDWLAVAPERAHTYIFNEAGLSRAEGNDFIAANREAAESSLKKAQSAQMPKMGKSIKAFNEAKGKRQEKIDEAQRTLDYWNQVQEIQKGIERVENDERDRIDAENRRQLAALQAETERKRAEQEEAARRDADALNGVPDMVDDTPQAARARGYRRVNGYKVDRQEPVQGLQGKEVSIKFSDNVMPQGRVAVIEASQLQPSHVGGQRNPLHFIDEGQPKERNDRASIAASQKIAGNIRPEEITSSVTAFTGAPTVNRRGEVIQGNNRSDALRQMWQSYPEQASKYKQYLMEHAEEFGLKPEDIEGMENPVLVNMLDVSDNEAISLGQYVAQDTESGGVERIKPKNALQRMGADIGTFANRLLKSSGDEEMSFSELLDRNGVDVLKWMSQKGIITPTQYSSAFDSRGNLSAEAKNDLRNILYQSIFKDGSTRLEEMFNTTLPAKAQKAILATAYRDYDSPDDAKMQPEIQSSIAAFNALWFGDAAFAGAKNYDEARRAVEAWKNQYQVDDATGESYLPAERFSNFALKLATIYRGQSQSFIQEVFNKMYDLIQGSQEATLFEVPDNTPRSLAEAIKETLNIDYDGQTRSTVLAGNGTAGEGGQRGSADVADNRGKRESGEPVNTLGETGDRGVSDWFGPVYTQFEGRAKEAEAHLREKNEGVAKGALVYPGVAPIDLVWGDLKAGYMKILIKHPEVVGKLQDILSDTTITSQTDNRIVFESDSHRMIVSRMKGSLPTDNWLLTAYEKKEKPVSASSSDIETEPEGKRNGTATPQNGAFSAANIAENQQPAKQNDENLTENAQPGGERALEREWNGYKSGLKFSPDAETDVEIVGFDYSKADDSNVPEVIVRGYDKQGNVLGTENIPGAEFDSELRKRGVQPQQPAAEVPATPDDAEEAQLEGRIEVSEDTYTEGGPYGDIYRQVVLIDGKHEVIKVDAPDKDGYYNGSYYLFDGRRFSDLQSVVSYLDLSPAEPVQAAVAAVEAETNVVPTEAQKEAGNYKKGHVKIDGFDISIENPKGSERTGTDASGRKWSITMNNTYGYIRGTEGVDGDHIDIFLSDNPADGNVYVIDQVNPDGSFDEHKVMYGFPDIESARKAYLSNYKEGWQGLGAITPVSKEEFKKWIASSHRKTKPFAEYSSVKPLGDTQLGEQPQYIIEPTTYTNKKGKTSPMHLVKFGRELSKEELRAGKELARESRGWWDREKGGFMMRDEESARKLAEALGNEEAVQDAQPLTVEDLQASNSQQPDLKSIDEPAKVEPSGEVTEQYDNDLEDRIYEEAYRRSMESFEAGRIAAIPQHEAMIRRRGEEFEARGEAILKELETNRSEAISNGALRELAEVNAKMRECRIFADFLHKKIIERKRDKALEAHGVKLGDSVICNGKEAKIYDAEADKVILDTGMAPVLYETTEWENITKVYHGGDKVYSIRHQANKDIMLAHHANGTVEYTFTDGTTAKADEVREAETAKVIANRNRYVEEQKAIIAKTLANDKAVRESVRNMGNESDIESYFDERIAKYVIANYKDLADPDKVAMLHQVFGHTAFSKEQNAETRRVFVRDIMNRVNELNEGRNEKPSLREVADASNGNDASSDAPRQKESTTEREEPKQEGGSKWVDDADAERFEELRKRLRDKLNGQANIGIDPEVFTIGVEMSYMVLKHGARKFAEFAKRMIEALGDNVRPYLKTFYNGARDLPEMADLEKELTPYDEVREFDVMNFDKKGAKDVIATAEHVVREQQAEREAKEAKDILKDQRNEQRKESEKQVAANTESVAGEAATVADEVESQLPAAGTEHEVNELGDKVDDAIRKVDEQLAVLGYYEAEPVAADFKEAYGYMRNAEKKALKNISGLYKELVRRLGIREPEAYDAKGKKIKPVSANIAPAGGDITMRITIDKDKGIELYMDFMLEPVGSNDMPRDKRDASPDDLRLRRIMWRIEQPKASGIDRYLTDNEYFDTDVKLEDMLRDIRSIGKRWLPVEDYVAMAEDVVRQNEAENKPKPVKNSTKPQKDSAKKPGSRKNSVSSQQDLIPDLFSGLFEEEPAEPETKPNRNPGITLVASSLPEDAPLLTDDAIENGDNVFYVTPQPETEARRRFSNAVTADLLEALEWDDKPFRSITDLRKRARSVGMEVDDEGRSDILLQELVEDGLVRAARQAIESGKFGGRKSRDAFDAICKLYELQPTIAQRSSNRIKMQQYSTPLPMGFVADMFVHRPGERLGLEPTAGNGMLVFALPANTVHVNELDETRLSNLHEQGFASVTKQDAQEPFPYSGYDFVVANPPFGSAPAKFYDGKEISGLDPQITLNALAHMKDDGRAAIIIGGNMEYADNGGVKDKRAFWTYLYDHYNVKGVVDMDGQLYRKQGTTFPTRMILIDGRRSEDERSQTAVYPPVKDKAVRKAESFADLYDIVTELLNSKEKTNGTEILRSQQGQLAPVSNNASGQSVRGGHSEQPGKNDVPGRTEPGQRGEQVQHSQDSDEVLPGGNRTPAGDGQAANTPSGSGTGSSGGNSEHTIQRVGGDGVSPDRVGLTQTQPASSKTNTPASQPKHEEKRTLETKTLHYRPHNTAFSLGSIAPAAMVESMDNVLSEIEKKHGNIDEFVRTELGYDSVEDAHNALAAEQMDGVAMAIYQMKQGQALIIGDQTGVGKGRQMAALIRWAVHHGEKPIFITQKADLFSDIYRDLVDVGSGDLNPFIFNSDGAMVNKDKVVVRKPLSAAEQREVFKSGKLPDEYDFAILTYSQVNTGDAQSQEEAKARAKENGQQARQGKNVKNGKATPKATFLRAIAKDNYLFLDESHTAAGSSNTGIYLQSILRSAKAVTFASATFAKRPDTMPLYAIRTAMSKANVSPEELIKIIGIGGVPLQEIMSRALTESGQMVRRERDMSDVRTDWETITDPVIVKRSRENYDRTIKAFNAIIKFQEEYVKPLIDIKNNDLAIMAGSADVTQGTDKMGIENVPFASKTYNYTKQLMLALKVDAIVDRIDEEIKAGRHPVIALESTMEASLKDYRPGEIIKEPTFGASLLRGLDSVMKYTIKDEDGNQVNHVYKPEELGELGEKAYYELQQFIRESTSGIFISPLDAIIEGLNQRGYKVGELTGRSLYTERDANGNVVVRRRTDKDKKSMQFDFNNGTLDVLILNKSASTGISLHASEKFKDQRQRSMLIAQPLSDINDYMQMIGRIDRTGQVSRGYYINLGLPVPAENRFLMMLSTKLKSLNANTTTSQDSDSNEVQAPDLLNKYGSQVIIEYLRDNPEIYRKMGEPLKDSKGEGGRVSAFDLEEYAPKEDDARKITGYVALLSTAEQDAFYDDVVRRYNDLIKYLNDTGNNDLKITVMPLRAKTIERKVSSVGADPNGSNPFARNAYAERVEMDVLRKPMKAAEVKTMLDQLNAAKGLDVPADFKIGSLPTVRTVTAAEEKIISGKMTPRIKEIVFTIHAESVAKQEAEEVRYANAKKIAEEIIAKQTEKINARKTQTEEEKQAAIERFAAETRAESEATHDRNMSRIVGREKFMLNNIFDFVVGQTYLVPDNLESSIFQSSSPAIFCGIKAKDSNITASTTFAVFATLDGRRRVEIKLSMSTPLSVIANLTSDNWDSAQRTTLDNWDSQIPTNTRKEGYILTGNILQAIADSRDQNGCYSGQLVSYTDENGGVHDGILMPDKWNTAMLRSAGAPLLSRLADIRNYKPVVSRDGKVSITGSSWAHTYYLSVPKSKKEGGVYFTNADILSATVGRAGFYPHHGNLRADISEDRINFVVKVLNDLGVRVADDDESEDTAAYRIREDAAPTNTGVGYKVFVLKNGKLYPPMVANLGGEATPVGIWLDADAAPVAGVTKTGRQQVKAGGKGTQGGSGKLAYRPGWHLGEIPYALQFGRYNPETEERDLFPANFVWAEVEYANDVDYNEEARSYGMNANGKYQHSLAGLPRVPVNGAYKYRTNPDPNTDPWIITGAMKVNRILKPSEVDAMVEAAGREPQQRQAGAVTDEQVEALNNAIVRTMREDTDMKRKAMEQMGAKLNTDIDIIEDVNSITHDNAAIQAKRRKSKGWYDTRTGQVHIVLANNRDVDDALATVGHETIAHKGLREMVGEERYDEFLDETYRHLRDDLKKGVDEAAGRSFMDDATKNGEKSKSYEQHRRNATDELFGRMAEKPFEEFSEGERTLWQKLKAAVRRLLDKFLGSLKLPKWFTLGDNELRYILWRSKERMERGKEHPIDLARDIVKREELGLSDDRYRTDETADIWSDQSMGLQERMTAAATRLAQNHQDNAQMRDDAMRAIGGNLSDLRRVMSLQRKFDVSTVKRVSDLAKVLMEGGYLNNLGQQEVKRLLSAVKNSVGSEDIEGSVKKVMDIMIDNQLKRATETLESLERIKGSKVDARGVEVQGQLDPDGAHIMKVFKEARVWEKADIESRIADAIQRMGSNDVAVADDATLDYAGLQLTKEYVENIKDSITEEQQLREEIRQTKQDGILTGQALKDFISSVEESIRENKTERIQAYYDLVSRLSDGLNGSIDKAKQFKEAEKQRIAEIQHNANSDMQGRPSDEHYKPKFMDKFVNNSFVSFLFAPLATFDQMLRMFGSKSANGEGYLHNRFMRGWVDARQQEIKGVREKFAMLDQKAEEIFGDGVKSWGDLIRKVGSLPSGTVTFWNGGEMQTYELTQGNLMYIYMVNKMQDGKMKLRKMGITEDDVDNILGVLDPRLTDIADWLQDEFLVDTRNEYNETHKRLFGASMAGIEHYFPLKILANARADKPEDLDAPDKGDGISTATGSIIKRRRNVLALDITGADALNVILDHVAQMEHWNAFAEFNRDLNTLRTYKRFRNQVQNMTTIYGSGKELWKKFNDVCQMAAGTYRPPRTKLDEAAVNFAKGVTAAKVSFRIFTALKQFLSFPAYIPEARPDHLIADIINPKGAWTWCMENLPIFNERWHSRIAGDPRLLKSDMDWKMWRSRVVQLASRVGMSPNAFVDALTVCIGAHAMYKTRLGQYIKDGYSREESEKKAIQDAEVLYNQTQQSSEGPFTSTMQVDRSWLSVLFTVFRNASMSYQRQLHDALRNLKHNLAPGGREKSIEFMRKQYIRDGINDAQALSNAKRKFNRQLVKDATRIGIFGYVMQLAWNLGAYLPYLLLGDDDNQKQKMWDDVWAHTAFGNIEGLTGGDMLSQGGAMLVTGEGNPAYLSKDMPLTSDIMAALQKLGGGKHTEALNDIINLVVQSGIGMNPQSITDGVLAIMEACGDNPEVAHEAAICVFRILQVPQSQIDKMYFDEVGLSGDEVSQYTPKQLAERYARFKVKRGNFFSPWSWDDGERIEKFEKKATKSIKERIETMGDAEVNEAYEKYAEIYKGVAEQVSAANKMKKDYVEYARLMSEAQSDTAQWQTYQLFKNMDNMLDKIAKMYLESKTAEEANLCRQAILDYKRGMVKALQAPDEDSRMEASNEIEAKMKEFSDKYAAMQPKTQANQ